MKHCMTTLLSLGILFCTIPTRSQAGVPFLDLDLHEVRRMAGEKGSLYFAFFTAEWCAPCRWMEERTFADQALIAYVEQNYLAVRVNVDQRESRVHQESFQVTLLPSILIFNAQGQLLAKIETALSGSDLLQILQEHDRPKHRIGSSPGAPPSEPILDSPKPFVKLYRPPLNTEDNNDGPPPPTELPPPVVMSTQTEPAPDRPAYSPPKAAVRRSTAETLAPRSRNYYSVQVATYDSYEQAIRQVAQLESGFKDPVRLMGSTDENGKQVFQIYIGIFSDRQQAEDFLFYLRRKNMGGVVKDMNEQ